MDDPLLVRMIGVTGIVLFVLVLTEIALYFVFSYPPSRTNVLTRVLLNLLVVLGVIAWVVGFRAVIGQTNPIDEWLGRLCVALALAHAVLTCVAGALQAGSVLGQTEPIDPTLLGYGTEGSLVIYGPLSRLLEAAFLAAAGSAIVVTQSLPLWNAWLAYGVAVLQTALIPTLFSGSDPARFYSINGWNIPIGGGLFFAWILMVSAQLLK